jgi:hypothetical protein
VRERNSCGFAERDIREDNGRSEDGRMSDIGRFFRVGFGSGFRGGCRSVRDKA